MKTSDIALAELRIQEILYILYVHDMSAQLFM